MQAHFNYIFLIIFQETVFNKKGIKYILHKYIKYKIIIYK